MNKSGVMVLAFYLSCTISHIADAICAPTLQWAWSVDDRAVCSTPLVVQLTDDNSDGVIDGCDDPEIVFNSLADGVIWVTALDGLTMTERWKYVDPDRNLHSRFQMSAGDIDSDGNVELVVGADEYILVLSHEGMTEYVFPITLSRFGDWTNIADLDQDGRPEIIIDHHIYDNSGVHLWRGLLRTEDSKAVDILPALPGLEVLMGMDFLFDSVGTELWRFPSATRDGFSAVADFELDGVVDIVGVNNEGVMMIDEFGFVRGTVFPLMTTRFSRPMVGDVNGDGRPNVVLADGTWLAAFEWNEAALKWSELWRTAVSDSSGNPSTPVGYDFDADGAVDVSHFDNDYWHLVEGDTGAILFSVPSRSITVDEASVIADIDGDGQTEIVIPSCNGQGHSVTGLLVYECGEGIPARNAWNETQYHLNNIINDGTVPVVEAPSWQLHNTWRVQARAGDCAECDPGSLPQPEVLLVVKVDPRRSRDVEFRHTPFGGDHKVVGVDDKTRIPAVASPREVCGGPSPTCIAERELDVTGSVWFYQDRAVCP